MKRSLGDAAGEHAMKEKEKEKEEKDTRIQVHTTTRYFVDLLFSSYNDLADTFLQFMKDSGKNCGEVERGIEEGKG